MGRTCISSRRKDRACRAVEDMGIIRINRECIRPRTRVTLGRRAIMEDRMVEAMAVDTGFRSWVE